MLDLFTEESMSEQIDNSKNTDASQSDSEAVGYLSFMQNRWMLLFVIFIIMPINGCLIESGQWILGFILIICQFPWILQMTKDR